MLVMGIAGKAVGGGRKRALGRPELGSGSCRILFSSERVVEKSVMEEPSGSSLGKAIRWRT